MRTPSRSVNWRRRKDEAAAAAAEEGPKGLDFVHHKTSRWLNRAGRKLRLMDPISTARYGMMAASRSLAASAGRVAGKGGGDAVDHASEAVTQIEAKQAFAADVGVIKIADVMWRSLLDLQTR